MIDRFVAGPAISWRHLFIDDKAIVVRSLLTLGDLMTIKAVETLARMRAHFKLVDDGILRMKMALSTLPARPNESGARLFDNHTRAA